jgi:hypothetical protein
LSMSDFGTAPIKNEGETVKFDPNYVAPEPRRIFGILTTSLQAFGLGGLVGMAAMFLIWGVPA